MKTVTYSSLNSNMMSVKVGDRIKIIHMNDKYASYYDGKEGVIRYIDDFGQLHGTWGGLCVIPEEDEFEIVR